MDVLIAEPDYLTALMLMRIFQGLGYTCHRVPDPVSVPALLKSRRFDIVVLACPAIERPVEDLLRRVRDKCSELETEIIILSTWAGGRGKCVDGRVRVIPKPFHQRDIVTAVDSIGDRELAVS